MKFLRFLMVINLFTAVSAYAQQVSNSSLQQFDECYYSQCFGYQVSEIDNERLFDCVDLWSGTRYKLAGGDEDGIDCSRFVMMVYNYVYGIHIDGTSAELYARCKPVSKSELKEGNLVFFRTSRKRVSHVGIYLGDNKFAHASTSSGIIISDLNEPYYQKRFAGCGIISN